MKPSFQKIIILFVLLLPSIYVKAQIKTLEIDASALIEDKNTNDYAILIYSDGRLLDSIFCKKNRGLTLTLASSKLYSLVFKKTNYPEKIVMVDTKIPSGLRELNEEPFVLQVELAKNNLLPQKQELTDFPVAVLAVNRKVKSLMASENYYKLTHN